MAGSPYIGDDDVVLDLLTGTHGWDRDEAWAELEVLTVIDINTDSTPAYAAVGTDLNAATTSGSATAAPTPTRPTATRRGNPSSRRARRLPALSSI